MTRRRTRCSAAETRSACFSWTVGRCGICCAACSRPYSPDIVTVGTLYRPGPMGMNAHNDYADRKNNKQKVTPIHPQLEEPLREILGDTYGLIVYQEQIMLIGQEVAGYSMGRADVLRRAMGKKKKEVLDQEYEGFHAGMRSSERIPGGFSDDAVNALWDTILPFAGYAFNKSHVAA